MVVKLVNEMKTAIFETHAHYDDDVYDEDRDELIRSFTKNGIAYVINSGADVTGCYKSVELAEKYSHVLASLGLHPDYAHMLDEEIEDYIRNQALTNKKVVAIGEIGLDYHEEGYDKEVQLDAFRRQMQIAYETKKPVVIHSREACADTLEVLREFKNRNYGGSMHCYSYSVEVARELVKMGYCLGIGGVVTFKNAKTLIEVVEEIPLENLLLETDAPYLAPVPYRGQRNSALNLRYIVQKIASIKGVEYDKVVDVTYNNAKRIFLKR